MYQELPDGGFVSIGPQVIEDPVEQLLREVEAYAEAQLGWDAKPIYLALFETPLGFEASDIGWLPEAMYSNPADGLVVFTAVIAEILSKQEEQDLKNLKLVLSSCLRPQFIGIAVFHESWAVSGKKSSPDQPWMESLHETLGPLQPSQHPDRKEMRNGLAVTIDGTVSAIGRIRGEAPSYVRSTSDVEVGGRVVDALKLLVQQVQQVAAL